MGRPVALAAFLTGLWAYGGYYYLEESIGFENLLLFLPHEIGQFLVGFFAPPFMLWLLVLQLANNRALRALREERGEEKAEAPRPETQSAPAAPELAEGRQAASNEPGKDRAAPVEPTLSAGDEPPADAELEVVEAELVEADAVPEPPAREEGAQAAALDPPQDVADLQREAEEAKAGPEPAFPGDEEEGGEADGGKRPPRRPAEVHALRQENAPRKDRRPPRRPGGDK